MVGILKNTLRRKKKKNKSISHWTPASWPQGRGFSGFVIFDFLESIGHAIIFAINSIVVGSTTADTPPIAGTSAATSASTTVTTATATTSSTTTNTPSAAADKCTIGPINHDKNGGQESGESIYFRDCARKDDLWN